MASLGKINQGLVINLKKYEKQKSDLVKQVDDCQILINKFKFDKNILNEKVLNSDVLTQDLGEKNKVLKGRLLN